QRAFISRAFIGIDLLLVVLFIPSLLGLINTLAINVLERTREIGVLRAIGATRAQVRKLVLAEALLLGAAGAALGMLAGLALGYGLTTMLAAIMLPSMSFSFPLGELIAAVAIALLMAVVASLLPARQAAGLRIVQALRYE
ncbi:MAG: FtsX-like permease family protein, partial [Chloroflexi bacterium]|nr:FtsX-like permease family protein [Chloroflexota bacterium]